MQKGYDRDEFRLFLKQAVPTIILNLNPMLECLSRLGVASPVELESHLRQDPASVTEILRQVDVLAANPAALELSGCSDLEDFAHHYPSFFEGEGLKFVRANLLQMAAGEREYSGVIPLQTKSGHRLRIQFSMTPMYEDDLGKVICNFIDVSHWTRAEEALEREQQTLHGSPVFSFRWRNCEGWPVESVSPNIIQLGYPPEDILTGAITFSQMVHPDDLSRVESEVEQYCTPERKGFVQEYRLLTVSGEVRWVYDYTSIVRDPNGDISYFDGFLLDITERKLAEQSSSNSEKRYQEMFKANPVSIWVEDLSDVVPIYEELRRQGVTNFYEYFHSNPELIFEMASATRVLDINQATLDMFGAATKEQLLGSLDKVFCPESLEGSIEVHAALAEKKRTFEVETVNRTLTGRKLHVLIKMNLPEEPDYSNLLVTMVDITARKQIEEKLAASESELESIYNQLLDTYYRTDTAGRIVRVSPSVEQLLGHTDDEVIGTKLTEYYIEPEKRNIFLDMLKRQGGVVRNHETAMRHKDGHPVWCLTNARFVYDESGAVIGVEGTTRDVSNRHRMDQELRKARDMAEQANRLKSDFLANMSHEIRTPMNGVVGFVNLLSRTRLDSEQRDYLETMKTSMGDLLAIVNDILDFSRVESNKLLIHKTEFDLIEAVSDVISLFSASATSRQLNLDMKFSRDVPQIVEGDPVRLRQILGNLIGNAIKFTDEGSVVLKVLLEERDEDAVTLRFSVEDTGIGITMDDAERLFDAFTQLEAGRAGGTGLGLAISRRLVELMGGVITATPRSGGGSIFSFTLALKPLHHDAPNYALEHIPEMQDYTGKKVLVVDDNAINRKLIATLLGKMGVEAVEASDGHDALLCHDGDCFDLIMMDIRMPKMDGLEATRQIRIGEERHERVPIVALTAHALPHEREQFILAGMDDCLTKPVCEQELFSLLHNYIG